MTPNPIRPDATTIAALLVADFTLIAPGRALAADQVHATVTLTPNRTVRLTTSNEVPGRVSFAPRFERVEGVCFTFTFTQDLLDPGDELEIALDHASGAFGFFNPWTAAQDRRTICLAAGYHDDELALFEDGHQRFRLTMSAGSVTIADLAVTVTGSDDR
jgi:hypothetical protein